MSEFTPQWYTAKYRTVCEMQVWVQAVDANNALDQIMNYDYPEMTPWEPIKPAKMIGKVKPAIGFEPDRDNP